MILHDVRHLRALNMRRNGFRLIDISRIPRFVVRAWDRLGDWSNVPVYARGRFEVRRIDIELTIAGIVCVSWYGYTGGWQGALLGGALYVLILLCALWLF